MHIPGFIKRRTPLEGWNRSQTAMAQPKKRKFLEHDPERSAHYWETAHAIDGIRDHWIDGETDIPREVRDIILDYAGIDRWDYHFLPRAQRAFETSMKVHGVRTIAQCSVCGEQSSSVVALEGQCTCKREYQEAEFSEGSSESELLEGGDDTAFVVKCRNPELHGLHFEPTQFNICTGCLRSMADLSEGAGAFSLCVLEQRGPRKKTKPPELVHNNLGPDYPGTRHKHGCECQRHASSAEKKQRTEPPSNASP